MNDIQALYHELIIDHGASPRNFRKLDEPYQTSLGFNPLCGDRIEVFLKFQDHKIIEASFQGQGCAISQASASLMTEALIGKSEQEALQLFQTFQEFMINKSEPSLDLLSLLGKLAALTGVRAFPMRIKCATLAWHTLSSALQNKEVSQNEVSQNEVSQNKENNE